MKNSYSVIQRVGYFDFVLTTFLIEAHKLPFLENYIDQIGIQPLADKPINLEETPVVYPQNRNSFLILNKSVVEIMVMPKRLHPKDKIVCYKISDSDLKPATVYYDLIDQVVKLSPSCKHQQENYIKSAFAVTPNFETQLIKAFLSKQPEDHITNEEVMALVKGKMGNSTFLKIKKRLGLTNQGSKKTKGSQHQDDADE